MKKTPKIFEIILLIALCWILYQCIMIKVKITAIKKTIEELESETNAMNTRMDSLDFFRLPRDKRGIK